jgi:glycosyltransferase involved in cell wall biosynthesis
MRHGGNLRWLNLSRELLLRGHRVYFGVNRHPRQELPALRRYLRELETEKTLTGAVEIDYAISPRVSKMAHGLIHPVLTNLCLRRAQRSVLGTIRAFIAEREIDAVLVSDRLLLFTVPALGGHLPVVIDWVDSYVLYNRRHLRRAMRHGLLRELPAVCRDLLVHSFQERYYTRHSSASLAASPVDKACVAAISGAHEKVHTLLNGIDIEPTPSPPPKVPTRLIFSGNMSFPPNHEAVMWFIDKVFPAVLSHRPDLVFVVAGRNPRSELISRGRDNIVILGSVESMQEEIAKSALYVAPLISGGGFKNKIAEAVMSGTYVAGTRYAVEFLPESLKRRLLVADGAPELAGAILRFLDQPKAFDVDMKYLADAFAEEFTWQRRADELLQVLAASLDGPPVGRGGHGAR